MSSSREPRGIPGRARFPLLCGILAALLVLAAAAGLLSGAVKLTPADLRQALRFILSGTGDDRASLIILRLRLPRLVMGMAVGAALAVSGASFQGFFRNSLADPFVIGASSGAALGAAWAIVAGLSPGLVSLAAFAGSLGAVALAFVLSRGAGNPPPAAALLLAGSALSAFCSALLSLLMVMKDHSLNRVYFWLLGSLALTTWKEVAAVLPILAAGCTVVFLAARPLDLLAQGDEAASSLGLPVDRARVVIAAGATLAVAAAVSVSGIIGFVGLIVPHAMRMIAGPAHKRLLPACLLAGALFVVLADLAARTVAAPLELPVGVISSLAGAPFFIYLLARHGRNLGRF